MNTAPPPYRAEIEAGLRELAEDKRYWQRWAERDEENRLRDDEPGEDEDRDED